MNQAHDVYEGVHHQQRNACNMRLAMLTQSSYCLQEQAGVFAHVSQKKAGSLMLIGIKAFRTNRHQQMAKRQAAAQDCFSSVALTATGRTCQTANVV